MAPQYEPSPVPSDADLWPGELPFTAWGQHEYGTLDLRVFDQQRYWVDIHQVPHQLSEMEPEYVRNVITFLLENREYFHAATVRRMAIQTVGDLLLDRPSAELVAEAVGAPALIDLTPEEWLESTPLMRALRARGHA